MRSTRTKRLYARKSTPFFLCDLIFVSSLCGLLAILCFGATAAWAQSEQQAQPPAQAPAPDARANNPPSPYGTAQTPPASGTPAPGEQEPANQGGTANSSSTQPPASAEKTRKKRRLIIGIDTSVFLPASSRTRDRFGSDWRSFGIGIGAVRRANEHGAWGLDFQALSRSNSGDRHVFVGSLGAKYRRAFAPIHHATFLPYWGVSLDAEFVDISSPEDNVGGGVEASPGGSLFIGTTIGTRESLELRYDALPDVKSFDLSGTSLALGIRF